MSAVGTSLANLRRSSARTTSVPDIRGSLGIRRLGNREHGDEGMPCCWQGKLRQVQRRGFAQVGYSLFDRFTLCGGSSFRIEGDEAAF